MAKRETTSKPEPASPELLPLETAFEHGDFARLREQLAGLPETARMSARVAALRSATSIDAAHVIVLALCLAALLGIAFGYLG